MNTTVRVINVLTRVTRREIPVQTLYNLLNKHILHSKLRLGLKHNCHYLEEEFMEALTYASLTTSAVELSCDRLRKLGCHAPTGHSVRDKLRRTAVKQLEHEVHGEIDRMVGRRLIGPVAVAVDLHKKPYYGCRGDPYVVGGRLKASTTKFHVYATAYVVTEKMRFTLALTVVKPGEKPHQILARLLNRVEKMVEVESVVADAGFYSVACIKVLEERGLSYIIHGEVRGKRMPLKLGDLENQLPSQDDAAWLGEHVLKSSNYGEVKVKLLAARPIKGQRLHIYAVSKKEAGKASNVYLEYEHRFGIDTSYRMIRKVWAWTRSKSPSLRFFLFFLAVLLYNLWVLAKMVRNEQSGQEYSDDEPRLGMLLWCMKLTIELKPIIENVIEIR